MSRHHDHVHVVQFPDHGSLADFELRLVGFIGSPQGQDYLDRKDHAAAWSPRMTTPHARLYLNDAALKAARSLDDSLKVIDRISRSHIPKSCALLFGDVTDETT